MSYKILVTSPSHNSGVSIVSILLNHLMTLAGKTSTLMFTEGECPTPLYLGLRPSESDPTRSIMQVVHLLENGAIKDSDILDYTIPYIQNGYLLDTSDPVLTMSQAHNVVQDVYAHVSTDVVICDDSTSTVNVTTDSIYDTSDLIFIVINPSRKHYSVLRDYLNTFPNTAKNKIVLVMNEYTETVGAARDIAKFLHFRPSYFCKLHYNPYITNDCLKGKCRNIVPYALSKDPRYANLVGDLDEFSSCVANFMLTERR